MSTIETYSPIRTPARLASRLGKDAPSELWSDGPGYREGPSPIVQYGLRSVAIVGARACSSYGAAVARSFAGELAGEGVAIVSGLARGIDAAAHRGALDVDGGITIGVLGCGIDRDYPAAHAELGRRIRESGLMLSEYGPGVEPAPWRFPARNRIIAGLADAVLVVEARERSGALITADFARSYGVPVFAIPGEITNTIAAGTNELLRLGHARICLEPGDLLESIRETREVTR